MIYLDYAANTPADKRVIDRFVQSELNHPFNPNSSNPLAASTREAFLKASRLICELLHIKENEIIYTSSATESNNLAIKGLCQHYRGKGKHIITSFLEHSSVNGAIGALIQEGFEVEYVRINQHGKVDTNHLKELLGPNTVLTTLCHVDSEIGLIQDINKIGQIIKENSNSYFHVDGTQAVGKIDVDLTNIDSYSFAAHKFYGLNGVGGLVLKEGVLIEPLFHGGISTTPYRSGTPSFGLVDSMALAMDLAIRGMPTRFEYVQNLKNTIINGLKEFEKVKINSPNDASPYIVNLSFNKMQGEAFKNQLAKEGVCLSTKSACCAPFAPSRPVYELTKDKKAARSTLRISLSHMTSLEEIQEFLQHFKSVYMELDK